ncbi:hypothetical protein KC19_8G041600 [Ceratodon purpureus]|uniref:non-specific serine/threonine protein kinase n=1 Tax=Ceratodon purpureus TaxID=3225 RepID=A0A8T0GV54_CERPU|nr:hypothetical protein KC19_8G041600 [Ceratodon purpureus]
MFSWTSSRMAKMKENLTKSCLSVALAMVYLNSVWAPAMAVTDPGDVKALLSLQQAWGGDTSLWSGSDPCLEGWLGILCDGSKTRVISLYLVRRDLAGEIPPEIGSLSALQNLDLSFNSGLVGEVPAELGSLTSLVYLSLQQCGLSGMIPPSLGKLVNMKFFALNNNRFTGEIPSALGALVNLTWFDVASNRLSGPLPVSTSSADGLGLDTWPNIKHYHLNDNNFSGFIPPELGNAPNLLHMLLEVNSFSGPIPVTFGNLSKLVILSLHYNKLTGPIPSTLNPGLHQIRVSNNQLSGTLPDLSALNQLEYVDFSNNSFDPQPFPAWLNSSSSTLQTIRFENGSLTGPLPVDILHYPALEGLYLQRNQLNGSLTIPENIGKALRYVSLQSNNILSIVQTAPNTTVLPEIQLEDNPLCNKDTSGLVEVSPTLCSAEVESIGSNSSATKWISPLDSNNSCQSPCTNSWLTLNPYDCNCGVPLIVTLEFRALTSSNIDDDALWESLRNQTYVSLSNLISQNNPPLKLEETQIWIKNAFFNETQVDTSKVQAKLYIFPLAGSVIVDQLTEDFIKTSFTYQKVTYASPFKPEIVIGIEPSRDIGRVVSGISKAVIIGIAVGAGALLALVAFLALVVLRLKRRAEEERKKNPFASWQKAEAGEAPSLKGARWFTFDDIKSMTNNFDDDNTLGVGGYGKVYKGVMAGTGAVLAVKRAQEGSKQGAQEFKNEIELLSRVHHNNLVGLVGFCYEKAEQMLVYEYMPNGSLTDWLRGGKSDQPLDWDRRLLIALGAARGVAYLHENANPPIIHRDVKACNILLDKSMNAKVADFGLSMLVPDEHDKRNHTIKGTTGYLDPEYYATSIMTPKSDVYSFGVVLLELVTGKPPVSRDGHIVNQLKNTLNRAGLTGVFELLDPVLVDTPVQDLDTFVKIALECVGDTSIERPSMHEVVKQLEALVGPKSYFMPGGDNTVSAKPEKRKQRLLVKVPNEFPDGFEPASGQVSQASASASSQQSFSKYSGGFDPSPR